MLSPRRQSQLAFVCLVAGAAALVGGFWWFAGRAANSGILTAEGTAQWVVYPMPPISGPENAREISATFRRTFDLATRPDQATLRVRSFRHGRVTLNGRAVELSHRGREWQEVATCDVADRLRAGRNVFSAEVVNDAGAPALWLSLTGPGWAVETDPQWQVSFEGATERPAHPACEPVPLLASDFLGGGERTIPSLRARLPLLLVFALLSAAVLAAVAYRRRRLRAAGLQPKGFRGTWPAVAVVAVVWAVLFAHNLGPLFCTIVGFDAKEHVDYIEYVEHHHDLPLADQGFEMHQPPFYYALAAGLWRACGLDVSLRSPGEVLQKSAVPLRLLGLLAGVIQVVLIGACLRLVFPGQPRRHWIGLLIAVVLPIHLYIFQFTTNEGLAAALGTTAVYLALRILHGGLDTARGGTRGLIVLYVLLGLCLGTALLTKVTELLVAVVVLGVLGGRLGVLLVHEPRRWRRTVGEAGLLGLSLVLAFAVCGGHYHRVWQRFGTSLIGNYDAASGWRWWQYPGYGTASYLGRFGRVFDDPFFSGFYGYGDGFYSTLWGDGMWGGGGSIYDRPPWNYDLMAAGYLLALVPTLAVLVGAAAALVQLVRRPRAEWFLLLGLLAAFVSAIIYQYLRYPYFGHTKAFYGLPAAVSLCALGAWGFDLLTCRFTVVRVLLGVGLGTWALTTYASYWVRPDAAETLDWAGIKWRALLHYPEAAQSFRAALKADPHNALARLYLAEYAERVGNPDEAVRLVQAALADHPDNGDAHLRMALLDQERGRIGEAIEHARRSCELAPTHVRNFHVLGRLLSHRGRQDEAVRAYRDALGIRPTLPEVHADLADSLASLGDTAEAVRHYRRALSVKPDAPDWLSALSWALATDRDPKVRDVAEAARLAERASKVTDRRDAGSLVALAAAQAGAGRYAEATALLHEAEGLPVPPGGRDWRLRIPEQLRHYEASRPYEEPWLAGPP